MKKYIYLLLAVAIISCNPKSETKLDIKVVQEQQNKNRIHLTKVQLATTKIKVGDIQKMNIRDRVTVTGTIEVPPQSKVTIYAPMEAFVFKTNLLPGDKVKKGQIVATLKHPNFIKLQYDFLNAVNKSAVAKADYDRKKMLLASEITSKKSFQIAEGAYKSAKSLVESYSSQLAMIGLSADIVLKNGIQQYIYVKTPIEGYVVGTNLNQGKFLSTNSEMMEIIDTDHMHAELNVFGADITKIKKGNDFFFQTSGVDVNYQGYIKLISQKVDNKTKTVNVHGHFEDDKGILKSGMFINAQILVGGKEVYAVPENAIIEIDEQQFVFLAKSDVEFIPIKVTTGNSDNNFTEIKTIKGNKFNVHIVTEGAHFLKEKWLQMTEGSDGDAH
ncbi:Cobalt-zinc-cadmium resistance protein CzcB [Polaribacter huanghezhanensis]|uniref:efflux RND transporter periplasmic adaptor subunit n=1 Tax=Polaribacter huanghezhanensis TaxID=1354726 RepID=UPI002648F912|nr:efflux RND transporter periplasmic adaptor subunit [Polaribacter huanghezhanensis]WKD86726.1 Cobalt-zinc-cadmium resistance protein CzcB [Polaribacter huanghezhanensis]